MALFCVKRLGDADANDSPYLMRYLCMARLCKDAWKDRCRASEPGLQGRASGVTERAAARITRQAPSPRQAIAMVESSVTDQRRKTTLLARGPSAVTWSLGRAAPKKRNGVVTMHERPAGCLNVWMSGREHAKAGRGCANSMLLSG